MKILLPLFIFLLAMLAYPIPSFANDSSDKILPPPRTEGGMALMQALRERQSSRSFSDHTLSDQMLSDLLWATFGINRPDSGRRTAPSARNWQEVDVYVVMQDSSYVYEPESHSLKLVAKGDLRALTGRQEFAATAPMNLVFVADISRMTGVSADGIDLYIGADVGFVSQNVYLFCASEGLATVVRANLDRISLGKALNLAEHQRIVLAQTVGYPAGYTP
ncbi:SagB/ThcOx family dehydrogenase [Desulfonatronum thiodismutans]|uniref:SagB/ThcOx family dehydrogenase n=1 Tax=Desulfonatronum thiodismutans TaxID=159290 RepID=UPI000B0B2C87|nr:SagB/ThcOx family dehydrogenase [Desulfonatronum thiodismutans]